MVLSVCSTRSAIPTAFVPAFFAIAMLTAGSLEPFEPLIARDPPPRAKRDIRLHRLAAERDVSNLPQRDGLAVADTDDLRTDLVDDVYAVPA